MRTPMNTSQSYMVYTVVLSFFLVLGIVGCKTSHDTTETKAVSILDPDGRTSVFFVAPNNPNMIIGRQCAGTVAIKKVSDIDHLCPSSQEDRQWGRQKFKDDFKSIFYMPEMHQVASETDYGDLLNDSRVKAEIDEERSRKIKRSLESYKILIKQSKDADAYQDKQDLEIKVSELEAELSAISDVATLVAAFNQVIDDLVEDIMISTDVSPIFRSSNSNHHFIVDALHKMHERGPTEYRVTCRVCRRHSVAGKTLLIGDYLCRRSSISKEDIFRDHTPCESYIESWLPTRSFTYTELPESERKCWEQYATGSTAVGGKEVIDLCSGRK